MYRLPYLIAVASCGLMVGCLAARKNDGVPNYGKGPEFQIPASSSAAPSSPVSVTFVDNRPGWEKSYYPGSNLLHRYDHAVTFLPMENFMPTVHSRFREEIQTRLSALPQPPTAVDIRLTSFRLVYDERKQQEERYIMKKQQEEVQKEQDEAAERERKAQLRQLFPNDPAFQEDDRSVGEQLLGDIFGACLSGCFEAFGEAIGHSIKESRRGESHLNLPPKPLRETSYWGLTCEMKAEVVLSRNGGGDEQFSLTETSYLLPTSNGYSAEDIPSVVEQGINRFSEKLAKKAAVTQR